MPVEALAKALVVAHDIDGGFSDTDVVAWMEAAVDSIESETKRNEES